MLDPDLLARIGARSQTRAPPAIVRPGQSLQQVGTASASARPALARAVSFGINNAHIGEYEVDGDPRAGDIDAIFTSLADVGAQFVRQPGYYDLIPLRGDGSLPRPEGIKRFLDANFKPRIRELLRKAREYDVPVVLTFLSLGGGVGRMSAPPPYDTASGLPMDFRDQAGATVTDLVTGEEWSFYDPSPGSPTWEKLGFDANDPFKLVYLQNFAYWTGLMVQAAAGEESFVNRSTADGYLLGIELVNEVNTVNIVLDAGVADPDASGALWGIATAYIVEGFRKARDEDPTGIDLPLWWPSLASENDFSGIDYILPFHLSLATNCRDTLASRSGVNPAILINEDTHWYRFSTNQGVGLAVQMVDVVRGLRANFDSLGLGPTISICETGATMTQDTKTAQYPRYLPDAAPVGDASALAISFHAREVVRRLGIAACSGATRAAWHSHMGNEGSDAFAGTGLRRDQDIKRASDAISRHSFYTYQRWQDLLGGKAGAIVRPVTATSYHDLDEGTGADALVVLRFPGTIALPFAWVMFVDSAYTGQRVSVEVRYPSGTTLQEVPLLPTSAYRGVSSGDSDFRDGLGVFETTPPVVTLGGDNRTLVLALDADPLLWFTSELLTFRRVWGT